MKQKWLEGKTVYAPSWLIIGISAVLMAVVIGMGIATFNREKDHTVAILKEKGAVLIWSLEAGARAGLTELLGNQPRLQTLLKETVDKSDISYIALIDDKGVVLAHSDPEKARTTSQEFSFKSELAPTNEPQWRMAEGKDGGSYFEVYKAFLPISPHVHKITELPLPHDHACPQDSIANTAKDRIFDPAQPPVIVIGMDIRTFEAAMSKGVRSSVILAAMIFLLSLTGVVSLFWVQSFLDSKKMLRDIRVFASQIVRNLPVGIVAVGEGDEIRFINGIACSLLAVAPEGAIGRPAESILPESLITLHRRINPAKTVVEEELAWQTAARTVPLHITTTNIVDETGQHLGFMFIFKDVSELRRLERKIRQREKMAAIGNLAAGIAHEVRNPLSSIKGYVGYLGSLFSEQSENRRIAQITTAEVDRVNRAISELLEFARPADLKPRMVNFCQLVEHALNVVTFDATAAGVQLTPRFAPDLPEISIDPDRIMQVLLNLLLNAIQAIEHGGEITVTVNRDNQGLLLNVTDNGKGMSEDEQANLFNPYFTTKNKGTGLGMAIVHKVIENHGGHLAVSSKPGAGTTISLHLPLTEPGRTS